MKELQEFISNYGLGISKEKLIEKAYFKMEAEGHNCYTINDRYISIDGKDYQIIKSRKEDRWIAKEF